MLRAGQSKSLPYINLFASGVSRKLMINGSSMPSRIRFGIDPIPMKKFKKYMRVIGLTIFIIFAAAAGGLFGIPLNSIRPDDPEKPRIEMVDKMQEEDDEEEENEEDEKS